MKVAKEASLSLGVAKQNKVTKVNFYGIVEPNTSSKRTRTTNPDMEALSRVIDFTKIPFGKSKTISSSASDALP